MVVGQVADHGQGELLRLLEAHEARARAHPRAPPEPSALHRLEQEARAPHPAQAEVGAERREEIRGDRRGRVHRASKRKRPPAEVSGRNGWCSSLAHAPASPVARPPPESSAGGTHRRRAYRGAWPRPGAPVRVRTHVAAARPPRPLLIRRSRALTAGGGTRAPAKPEGVGRTGAVPGAGREPGQRRERTYGTRRGHRACPRLRWGRAAAVIVSAVRTPFGRVGGGLADPFRDGARCDRDPRGARARGIAGEDVGYVVMGQVLQAGVGQAPARQAAIAAGIPKEVPADTINKVCASSIRAVELAELMIAAGRHDVVVTGGMESMSLAPVPPAEGALRLPPRQRRGPRPHGLRRPDLDVRRAPHGQQASSVSRELGISRRSRTPGHTGLISAPRRRRTPGASTTRSSRSATSAPTRASAATRRWRSSRR